MQHPFVVEEDRVARAQWAGEAQAAFNDLFLQESVKFLLEIADLGRIFDDAEIVPRQHRARAIGGDDRPRLRIVSLRKGHRDFATSPEQTRRIAFQRFQQRVRIDDRCRAADRGSLDAIEQADLRCPTLVRTVRMQRLTGRAVAVAHGELRIISDFDPFGSRLSSRLEVFLHRNPGAELVGKLIVKTEQVIAAIAAQHDYFRCCQEIAYFSADGLLVGDFLEELHNDSSARPAPTPGPQPRSRMTAPCRQLPAGWATVIRCRSSSPAGHRSNAAGQGNGNPSWTSGSGESPPCRNCSPWRMAQGPLVTIKIALAGGHGGCGTFFGCGR